MDDRAVKKIKVLLDGYTPEEQRLLFLELRKRYGIHPYEQVVGASAETILEAIHRAPELTRRMLRGVIADAAFAQEILPTLAESGWLDVTEKGNFAYDYKLTDNPDDPTACVTVQVKLQRSEKGQPVIKSGSRFGLPDLVFMTETQRTRGGTDGENNKTRPYHYGHFDILAVSMQPSGRGWGSYTYTLGRWLVAGKGSTEIAVMQPVTMAASEFWTPDFNQVVAWFRAQDGNGKRMKIAPLVKTKKQPAV